MNENIFEMSKIFEIYTQKRLNVKTLFRPFIKILLKFFLAKKNNIKLSRASIITWDLGNCSLYSSFYNFKKIIRSFAKLFKFM